MPERAWCVAQVGRVPDSPRPEEPVLQSVHRRLAVRAEAILHVVVPVEPLFEPSAVAQTGGLVGRSSSDAVEPLAAVVDSQRPFAANDDTERALRVVRAATPAASGTGLTRCQSSFAANRRYSGQLTCTSQGLLLGSPKARYGC